MIVISAHIVGLIAIYLWHRRSWRKWDALDAQPDNSLAGTMERGRRTNGGAE